MNNWTDGYVAEIDYTYGFYRELTPALLQFALLLQGVAAPDIGKAFTYCELGYGQGFGANLLAAANPHGEFRGTDFNPQHAAGARSLAAAAGLENAVWSEDSFCEFLQRDLPDFDFISLHGIYSWISAENRAAIVEFIRRRLKPGGVVYISYNALPGWAPAMPLRQLMTAHAAALGAAGMPLASRLQQALQFSEELTRMNAGFFRSNPGLAQRLEKLKGQNPNYLAHEYLNRDWVPKYFSEVSTEMTAAKLTFAGSANCLDHVDAVNYPAEVAERLAKIADPVFRETVRDYVINAQFRRDLFVRGKRTLSSTERSERLLDTRFMLQTARSRIKLEINLPIGQVNLQPAVYEPLLDALQEQSLTLRELVQRPPLREAGSQRLIQALTILVGLGHVQPCLDSISATAARVSAAALNRAIMAESLRQQRYNYLAAPETGSAVPVSQISQFFISGYESGARGPQALASVAWQALQHQGVRMLRDGKPLATESENLEMLKAFVGTFETEELPALRKLGII